MKTITQYAFNRCFNYSVWKETFKCCNEPYFWFPYFFPIFPLFSFLYCVFILGYKETIEIIK
jgi:hypothetical protein